MQKIDVNDRQADATGLAASAAEANGALPFLGDAAVIDRLLRDLAKGVFDRFADVSVGNLSADDAAAADQEACHQLARILIGQSKGYQPVRGWTDHALAEAVRRSMNEAVHDEDDVSVMAQAVAVFVHSLYLNIAALEDPEKSGEVQSHINDSIQSFTNLLLGIEQYE